MTLTKKETVEKRKIDRKVLAGKVTRKEILRGLELLKMIEKGYKA